MPALVHTIRQPAAAADGRAAAALDLLLSMISDEGVTVRMVAAGAVPALAACLTASVDDVSRQAATLIMAMAAVGGPPLCVEQADSCSGALVAALSHSDTAAQR